MLIAIASRTVDKAMLGGEEEEGDAGGSEHLQDYCGADRVGRDNAE